MSEKGFLRKVKSVNRNQINPLPLNLEGNNFSRRNRNIINEENGFYILSQKLDTMQNDLKNIGNNVKFIKTGIFELGEIMKNSFNRLENLLREMLIYKIPNRDDNKKKNFHVKKEFANIELSGDKKEIKHVRINILFHSEYNGCDKNESNDSKNNNCSINQRSVNNLSYTSNRDIVFFLKSSKINIKP